MSQTEEYDSRIISGAAELFRTYGIRAVTMDMIAGHLGISKRTIYERFHDKDELLFAVMTSMIARQKEKVETILDSSPNVIAAIFTMIRIGKEHATLMNPLIGADLRKYHNVVLERIKEKCAHPDYEAAERMLVRGVEQGLIKEDINVYIASRFIARIGNITGDDEVFPPEKFLQRDLIKNTYISYLRGISTGAGVRLIDKMESELFT